MILLAALAGWLLPDLQAGRVPDWYRQPDRIGAWGRDTLQRVCDGAPPPVVLRPQPAGSAETFQRCLGWRMANCVIDGDTIRYQGDKIRLADIDAPEIFSPKCAAEAALGERASERLLELLNDGRFEVVRSGRDQDPYGRQLRIISRHGGSLGDVLVAEGLARPWDGARRSWCG